MKIHTIFSGYKQFYVADVDIDPAAPEDWTDDHILQRHYALRNIVALCPEGDITARVICMPPGDEYKTEVRSDFEVNTEIEIKSGRLGILGWPWELLEEFHVSPGIYKIHFTGYNLAGVDNEGDYYVVEFKAAEQIAQADRD